MAGIVTGDAELRYDRLCVIPLGGQSELGQALWIFSYGGELLLVDAGAAYPYEDMPGVDLLLPSTNFLEANQERISALLLTNGHEEHCGAVNYLLNHLKIPRIMAPKFVASLVSQNMMGRDYDTVVDTVTTGHPYQIGVFDVEWIAVNDAIADACALKIGTPEGVVVYTSSFKLDQTPVDGRLSDMGRLAGAGDSGVLLLMSNSAGVENPGYTPSERSVVGNLEKHVRSAPGRVIVVVPGTNTHRLQLLFDLALSGGRKVVLLGESLIRTAVVAALTGNLVYDRKIESSLSALDSLADSAVLVVATGQEGDPLSILHELAYGRNPDLQLKEGDTVLYSAEVAPGYVRQFAWMLDRFLSMGINFVQGSRAGIHVAKHASQEELKLMLSVTMPRFFVPMLGEGRHIMHHAQLAVEWGLAPECVFPLKNGQILEIGNGVASVLGEIESQSVLYNRDQGERVTTHSVNERRVLSLEGVMTVFVALTGDMEVAAGPTIETGASGFLRSAEWLDLQSELNDTVLGTIASYRQQERPDINAMRNSIRDAVNKLVRSRLQSKPVVQVIVHELVTSRPE